MVQDSTTYYVWIGGSCDYGHKEPTHEARAETKLVWALPCKKEEDEVNVLVVTPGNGIVVHLNEVEEARKVLDIVKLSNIVFQENGVAVEGKIR